jgi:quercetin dioxygenase-like cupin family protein
MTNDPSAAGAPQARIAAELVAYQEGSVVSRTILKKPTGTVTVFAFDEGQALSEHTVPFEALILVLDGAAEVTIAGRAHRVAAGETLLLPPNQPHAVRALERFKMILTMIRS